MKKILFLTIGMTIANSLPAMGIVTKCAKYVIAGACSLTEAFITTSPLIYTVALDPSEPEYLPYNAPRNVINHIQQQAQKRGLKNIGTRIDDEEDSYYINTTSKIIYIPSYDAEELNRLLESGDLNLSEKKALDKHNYKIFHEIEHGIRQSSKYTPIYEGAIGTLGAIMTSATATHITKKYIPAIKNNFTLRNGFKIVRSAPALALNFALINMNLYSKYDELKADDGIPNKKELLEAAAEDFEKKHNEYLECINVIKKRADYSTIIYGELPDDQFRRKQLFAMKALPITWFNKPLVMDAIFHANTTHPSDLRRAKRLRKREQELERQELVLYKDQSSDDEVKE